MALTQKEITGLKPKTSSFYVWDDDGTKGAGRLGVKVYPSKNKTFVFRYYRDSKRVFIQLGRFPELSLSAARETAKEHGLWLKQGIDPKEHLQASSEAKAQAKQEEAQQGSLQQLFYSYTEQMRKDGKRTHEAVLTSLEKEVYPHIPPATKAKNVTTQQVITVLANMIRREAVTQSNRVRSYLMAAFNYGLAHDNDPANYIEDAKFGLTHNPVSAIPKQKAAERVGEHYLEFSEVKQLLDDLQNDYTSFKMGQPMRHLLQLCFFAGGQRPYELFASKWQAVDWQAQTLEIPAELSKNKRPHLVPLTDSAIQVLRNQRELSEASEFIFPHRFENTHVRNDSLSQAIARYRQSETTVRPFVARDIRRTCKTLMGKLGISKATRDRLQNHALNDVSSKHYDRYDYEKELRRALEVWEQKLNEVQQDNVIMMEVQR